MSLGGEDGEIFPEVEPPPQVVHRLLPGADLFHTGRTAQPVGQRLFSRLGPGGGQQLEERAWSEEIEIARVWVVGGEPLAIGAGARPSAVHPIEAAQVQPLGPRRAFVPLQHERVHDHQGQEQDQRHEKHDHRSGVAEEHEPPAERREQRRDQPQVGDEEMRPVAAGNRLVPAGDALAVFGARVGHAWRHCVRERSSRARRTLPATADSSSAMATHSSAVCAT